MAAVTGIETNRLELPTNLQTLMGGGRSYAITSDRIIQCAPDVFTQNLNRLPYEFAHSLAGTPLFELSRLVDLAEKVATRLNPHLAGGDVYFNDGLIEPGEKPLRPDLPRMAAADLIRKIDSAQAWIILKHVEREPGYREVLENCIRDILQLSGPQLLRKIKWFEAILFITSPNRVTEYHLDREVSWILQLQGDKEIHVFDRADKDIVPDQELEVYWTADNRAARYKPEYESRAIVYQMRPGSGVHIPINSPHWLRNKKQYFRNSECQFPVSRPALGELVPGELLSSPGGHYAASARRPSHI